MAAVDMREVNQIWTELHDRAAKPYRCYGTFAWHFARGKLGHDPVFRGLIEQGLLRPILDAPTTDEVPCRVVDLGCGQGLMASLLQSVSDLWQQGRWPAAWPVPPKATSYTGIELMPNDVARAQGSIAGLSLCPQFVCADMRHASFPPCELVVILDVLHYVDHLAQEDVLRRVFEALSPGGRLLLRVGDMDRRGGFLISQWVDRLVTTVRGHRVPPTFGRTLAQWTQALSETGFSVQSVPMNRGTPFANILLVADKPLSLQGENA
jgi:SAM-dependent methyltransferase